MYKKSCPYCKGNSFSASLHGKWKCPYCHADLTIFMPEPDGSVKREQSGVNAGSSDERPAKSTGDGDKKKCRL